MRFDIQSERIPGTVLSREKMGGAVGGEFLGKIYFISNGIMLAQVREISGVDGTTLQNWVKRGWVANPQNKMYDKDMLARILIINMMRDTMQLSRISFLLKYINGSVNTHEDDIIPESVLYDYICRLIDTLIESDEVTTVRELISACTADYEEKISGARRRLNCALEIIVSAYWASVIKSHADRLMNKIENV